MVHVAAPESDTPVTWIVEPTTPTDPHVEAVKPGSEKLADGADQRAGTASETVPPARPPAPAVNVNVSVFPVDPVITVEGETDIVPEPSAERIVTCGGLANEVSV